MQESRVTDNRDVSNADPKLITVLPVTKGGFSEPLSYFTTQNIQVGFFVKVPLGKREILGLVQKVLAVTDHKYLLKTANYETKKIVSVLGRQFFSQAFMKAVEEIAIENCLSQQALLAHVIPKFLISNFNHIHKPEDNVSSLDNTARALEIDVKLVQAPDDERMAIYRSLIREHFARGKSIAFFAPTITMVEILYEGLCKGVEEYSFAFHGSLTKSELENRRARLSSQVHPVVVVSTPHFAAVEQANLRTIVIEHDAGQWKQLSAPYIDLKYFLERYAYHSNSQLIYGGPILSVSTLERYFAKEFHELSPLRNRLLTLEDERIIDMRKYDVVRGRRIEAKAIGSELSNLIRSSKSNNESVLLVVNRRGKAGNTICHDCGELVKCRTCISPLVLYSDANDSFYLCRICHERTATQRRCAHCDSWKLYMLSFGIDYVAEEIARDFLGSNVIVFSSDHVTTRKRAQKIVNTFLETPGSILLATDLLLNYLSVPVPNVGIISLDQAFAAPEYTAFEELFHKLVALKRLAKQRFYIQTRYPDSEIYHFLIAGIILDFYRNEVERRKKYGYPPFMTIIKITLTARSENIMARCAILAEALKDWGPIITQGDEMLSSRRSVRAHIILKIPRGEWPNERLSLLLSGLGREYSVVVNPQSLL